MVVQSLKTLVYIYVVGYAVIGAWTVIGSFKDRDKEPWWDIASDLILIPLGFIGMLLYLFNVGEPSWIRSIWKGVSVAIVLGQLITNVLHRHLLLSGRTAIKPEEIPQWAILAGDLTAVVVLAPMAALNIMYAFSLAR